MSNFCTAPAAPPATPAAGASGPPPGKDVAAPARTGADGAYIRNFIHAREGNIYRVYIPCDRSGVPLDKSGPTIGAGFDLGQHAAHEIRALSFPPELAEKLLPYVGKKGMEAKAYIAKHPLALSREEIERINTAVMERHLRNVATRVVRELTLARSAARAAEAQGKTVVWPTLESFAELPRQAQAALASLLYQYGPNSSLARGIIRELLFKDYGAAARQFRLIADRDGYKYPTRRKEEAALLEEIA